MRRFPVPALALLLLSYVLAASAARAEDARHLVSLPPAMQNHMLANMRDHLKALDEIFKALAADRVGEASRIAERRLGMSSLEAHGAGHMAPYMPEAMRAFGTAMHRAASRFARAIETSDIGGPTPQHQREIYAAFGEITANCTGCHEAYRLR